MSTPLRSTARGRVPRTAYWLFAGLVLLRVMQSVVCLVDPRGAAASADGIPLERYPAAAAETIASLFALNSYGRLMLCVLAAVVLLRMRPLTPWLMWAFLVDQLGRRLLLRAYPLGSVGDPPGEVVSWTLIAINVLALALYFVRPRSAAPDGDPSPEDEPLHRGGARA